ncbi:hypothetical protein RBU60_08205 [Mesonia sp. MT50]|uniref:Uncharacterized protein n=1 Tax=Mesonia profundi TaxID=3070998 RepID=A0ABU1A1H2_9FLAO|nr:hypothetical protein [Mesonia profundi]MDQ7917554.1 hypothetical protein [Mesonia profundi]
MKNLGLPLLAITTFILLTVTIFAAMGFSFSWIFYLTILGKTFLVFTVYRVLKDHYSTKKTFADGYEDVPYRDEYKL